MNLKKTVIMLALTLVSQTVLALPKAMSLNYSVHKGSINLGDMNLSLRYNGNKFQYYKSTEAKGFAALITKAKITEKADGSFAGDQLTPVKYFFSQSTRKGSRVENAHFSGTNVRGTYKDKPYDLNIPRGTLDRASLELALANDIKKNDPKLTYNVMERGKLKQYTFKRYGNEQIITPKGNMNAIKVSVLRADNERSTTFWLAKELDFMPIKIVHTEKNDVITTQIKNYTLATTNTQSASN